MNDKQLEEMKKVAMMGVLTEQDAIDQSCAEDDVINEVERRVKLLIHNMLKGMPNEAKNNITRQALHSIYWSDK